MRPILRPFPDRRPDYLAPWRRGSVSLVDSSKWIGFWAFDSADGRNSVGPASDLVNRSSVYTGLFNYAGNKLQGLNAFGVTPGSVRQASANFPAFSGNVTFGGYLYDSNPSGSNLKVSLLDGSSDVVNGGFLILLNKYGGPLNINGHSFIVDPDLTTGLVHVLFVCDFTSLVTSIYIGGVFTESFAMSAPLVPFSQYLVHGCYNGFNDFDNMFVYGGLMSPAAIAALAAGRMPDAAGNLI